MVGDPVAWSDIGQIAARAMPHAWIFTTPHTLHLSPQPMVVTERAVNQATVEATESSFDGACSVVSCKLIARK